MKRFFVFVLFTVCLAKPSFGQKNKLRVYFNTVQFYAPEIGNYVELHFQFDAKSLKFATSPEGIQSKIYLSIEIKDSLQKIHFRDEYALNSPLFIDSIAEDFYELRRIPLQAGKYQINLKMGDLNVKSSEIKGSQLIVVEELTKQPNLSQIEAIDFAYADTSNGLYQKNGYYILPKLTNYYGTGLNNLPVYFELNGFNSNTDSAYFLEQSLLNVATEEIISEYSLSTPVMEKGDVLPFLRNVNIRNLPTGEYMLKFMLTDRNKKVVSTQNYTFERGGFELTDTIRSNEVVLDPAFQKSISDDSLHYFLGSLLPIARAAENKNIRTLLKGKNASAIRKYIQAFWNNTKPGDAYEAWIRYKEQVLYVQQLYKTNYQHGYETDRGRVYLRYGTPSTVNERETSPTEYPYEIWFYNKIDNFSNKRFIFYNPDLTNNSYRLLHSDLIGEVKNQGWSQVLSKRNTNNGTVDDPNLFNQRHWGQDSNDLFRQY